MNPEIVIALYRPNEGGDEELRALIDEHIPTLRRLELITDRPAILCRSKDGTYLEIFEWRNANSSSRAHEHPEVARIWEAMGEIAAFPALSEVPEAGGRFPHFTPIDG